MTTLYLDTETYSETPIKYGTYKYIENAECMIITYAFDDEPVQCIGYAEGTLPAHISAGEVRLQHALRDPDVTIVAHNSVFDRNVLKRALLLDIPVERWRCTMMRAYLHGLPGSLDKLSDIFKLGDSAKHKEGKDLIKLFCKPNKNGERNTYVSHPEEWERFKDYAKSDIEATRKLDLLLPKWNINADELAYWFIDQKRNDRGVALDVELAQSALRAVDKEQLKLKGKTQELTENELESTTKRDKMLAYMLEYYGVSLPDLTMSTIERRLEDPDLPVEIKELLAIRLQASTTSTSKYKSMLRAVNDDGRVRGLIQFAGAFRTGRDAGRTVQPQNFPSRNLLPQPEIDLGVEALKTDAADIMFDNVMALTSSCLRSSFVAPKGKKLVAADLSNIEGRYLAWVAGEEWKIKAFEDLDLGIGEDLYKLAYARSFVVDATSVTKHQRQIGKTQELFLGFQGGAGAFFSGAVSLGIDLDEMAEAAYNTLPDETVKDAIGFYEWTVKQKRSTFGMSKKVFVTCESLKRLWRDAHPNTVALWGGLEAIVRQAITQPSKTFQYGRFKARRDGSWLRLVMPSGRALCYPMPQVDDKGQISFMGVNQYSRKWERIKTFGGKLVENATQAGARDVFKHGERKAEEAGYSVVFPVHDELVTEVPDTPEFSAEGLAELMSEVPVWAEGLPLAAEGFEAYRYRK